MRRPALFTIWSLLAGLLALPGFAAESRSFEFSVLVDGSPLPEYFFQGKTYIEALRGRPFSLKVSNPTSERIAVAISVDGRNVVDARRTGERQAAKWVLDPWQTVEIPGWQISGDTARRFFFTETAHSYARWLGDTANVGMIEAIFFREKSPTLPITLERPRRKSWPDAGAMSEVEGGVDGGVPGGSSGSSDRLVPGQAQAPNPEGDRKDRPAEATRDGIRRYDHKPSDGYAATGIGERTRFPVQWVHFDEDPSPAARIALRYEFHRELVRLGVLSRGLDDLWAREHSRGFAPEYAPDPDRNR